MSKLSQYRNRKTNQLILVLSSIYSILTLLILTWDLHFRKNQINSSNKFLTKGSSRPKCPSVPQVTDFLNIDFMTRGDQYFQQPMSGGKFNPEKCQPNQNVAIIVPYRERKIHLKIFTKWMHYFLQKQSIGYRIYVVEQKDNKSFNRAKLMNIGFKEAKNDEQFDCYIFHDVDLLPLNVNNLYTCGKNPRHLSCLVDNLHQNRLPYWGIFGGANALTETHFRKINGYSNQFWGWGGEDDEFSLRLSMENLSIARYPMEITKYHMLIHKRDIIDTHSNYMKLKSAKAIYKRDGLQSLKYDLLAKRKEALFTRIMVIT